MCGCGKKTEAKGGASQRLMVPTGQPCPDGFHRVRWWERHGDERVQEPAPFCDKVEEKMKTAGMRGLVVEMRRVRGQISEGADLRDLTEKEIEKLASLPKVKKIAVENFLSTLKGMSQYEAEMNLAADAKSYKWSRETVKAIKDGIRLATMPVVTAEQTDHERCPDGSHWNDDKQKCMKLNATLRLLTKDSHEKSAKADTSGSAMDHVMAQASHTYTSAELQRKGFHSLARKHDEKSQHHLSKHSTKK